MTCVEQCNDLRNLTNMLRISLKAHHTEQYLKSKLQIIIFVLDFARYIKPSGIKSKFVMNFEVRPEPPTMGPTPSLPLTVYDRFRLNVVVAYVEVAV